MATQRRCARGTNCGCVVVVRLSCSLPTSEPAGAHGVRPAWVQIKLRWSSVPRGNFEVTAGRIGSLTCRDFLGAMTGSTKVPESITSPSASSCQEVFRSSRPENQRAFLSSTRSIFDPAAEDPAAEDPAPERTQLALTGRPIWRTSSSAGCAVRSAETKPSQMKLLSVG
ncbi:unannotated protein [freshwater metagenome]|uniref:Unannotated protein n=1 Tax=freshwater metagenome TaxID=449393 RepID=A0A6J6BNF1_9ZZZZ